MKKTTKPTKPALTKGDKWVDDTSPIPDPAPLRERVVTALENLLSDYRAGRGDVASRMTPWFDENGIPRSFVDAITVMLLGEGALPETRFNGGSVTVIGRREYAALASIGEGSAERGAGIVVDAALDWLRKDRAGMLAWVGAALPSLKKHGFIPRWVERGLLQSCAWVLPVQHPTWWGEITAALEGAEHGCAEDVVRSMALAWHRGDPVAVKRLGRAA